MASTRQERYNLIYGNTARQMEKPEVVSRPAYEPKRKVEKIPKKKPSSQTKRNQRKAYEFDFNFICVMAVACAIVFSVSFLYLSQRSNLISKQSALANKKNELNVLVTENEDMELELDQSVNLTKIEEVATKQYGMQKPGKNKVITYKSKNGDYVRQYGDIPSTN
ncbi:MAG: cell division protein FtsL [Anaerostipes sp.]|nr:cell division protein FtsL [Anaerostipes sp.]